MPEWFVCGSKYCSPDEAKVRKRRFRFQPDYRVPPGESIKESFECRGITVHEFAKAVNLTVGKTRELLKGVGALTEHIATVLEQLTYTPAAFWMRLEANYRKPK